MRHAFFSFHYQRDIFRVNQIRSLPNIMGEAAAGFRDASLWEEAKRKGDTTIKGMIDRALHGTTVTVVCIGYETAGRRYIDYEINESLRRGNGVIGVRINHLIGHSKTSDPQGAVPQLLQRHALPVYTYQNTESLARWIEHAAMARSF
ncbi:TIR domain-containing protein [Lysobacter yangpyeongensis]|uniref:TIR domain-containing protein n=1 Tax=Lysobacter yangpyeongensis TaxID=346182 RepID=A0ABW0SIS2_9GAMM